MQGDRGGAAGAGADRVEGVVAHGGVVEVEPQAGARVGGVGGGQGDRVTRRPRRPARDGHLLVGQAEDGGQAEAGAQVLLGPVGMVRVAGAAGGG